MKVGKKMKSLWLLPISLLLVSSILLPIFFIQTRDTSANAPTDNFFFGTTFGSNSTKEIKTMIDKVKGYTNLFILTNWDIAMNETATNEVLDYAVSYNLSVMLYLRFIFYNVTTSVGRVYNSSTWDEYGVSPWHVAWLNNASHRWGDKFLGVYLYDEPGGKQIDLGYWGGNNVTFAGTRVSAFDNTTNYNDAAARYNSTLSRSRSMQILINTSYPQGLTRAIPAFTSDYALYWFDYKAGYKAVFAELGGQRGNIGKNEQISLCRGAATAQNKQWGAIITWTYNQPPYYENAETLLQDMYLAYQAGANYVIVFNYSANPPYNGLDETHFVAMKEFWNQTHSSPRTPNTITKGEVAFVLPSNYGWGMRWIDDKIWGLWQADDKAVAIWNNLNLLIEKYGSKLDIVYDDPQFSVKQKYSQLYYWNSTIT